MPGFTVQSVADGCVTLTTTGTNYQNLFKLGGADKPLTVGQRVHGTIHATAWKAELVSAGGNYVEPLLGRPRRMQGVIKAANAAANELTVHVGYDVTVKLPDQYRTFQFPVGARVGWDNSDIPTFQPDAAITVNSAGG